MGAVAYLLVHEGSSYPAPALRLAHFKGIPGLQRVFALRPNPSPGPTRFVSLWRNADDAKAHEETLAKRLPESTVLATSHFVVGDWPRPLGLLRRAWAKVKLTPKLVAAVLALLGLLELVRARHEWLLGSPDLAFDGSASVSVTEGHRFQVPIRIRNGDRGSSTTLYREDLRATWRGVKGKTSALTLSPQGTDAPDLKPGQSVELVLQGQAPPGHTAEIEIGFRARAGWLLPDQDHRLILSVRIWKALQLELDDVAPFGPTSDICRIPATLRCGRSYAAGVECSLVIRPEPGSPPVTLHLLDGLGTVDGLSLRSISSSPDPSVVIGKRWQTGPLEAFTDTPGLVVLRTTQPLTLEQWRQVVPRLEFGSPKDLRKGGSR
jgi:hypothetical protein